MLRRPLKIWLFFGLISMTLIFLGHQLAGHQGLLWTVSIALGVNALIYFYGDLRAKNYLHGHLLEGQDPWGLLSVTAELAHKARIPVPKVLLIPSPAPQALSVGKNWHSARIYITQGLVENLPSELIRAVLAQQVASIRNLDTLSFTLSGAITEFLYNLAYWLDASLHFLLGGGRLQSRKPRFLTKLVMPLMALAVRLPSPKRSFLKTDELAAKLCGDPRPLAEALWRLDAYSTTKPFQAVPALAHFFIVNPLTDRGWARYLRAQPNLEERVKNLLGYYPI